MVKRWGTLTPYNVSEDQLHETISSKLFFFRLILLAKLKEEIKGFLNLFWFSHLVDQNLLFYVHELRHYMRHMRTMRDTAATYAPHKTLFRATKPKKHA